MRCGPVSQRLNNFQQTVDRASFFLGCTLAVADVLVGFCFKKGADIFCQKLSYHTLFYFEERNVGAFCSYVSLL